MRRRLAIVSGLVVLFVAWSTVAFATIVYGGNHVCTLLQPVGPDATPWADASLSPEQWAQITHERCDRPMTGQAVVIGAGYVALVVLGVRSLRSPR